MKSVQVPDDSYQSALKAVERSKIDGRVPSQSTEIIRLADRLRRANRADLALNLLAPIERFFAADVFYRFVSALTYRDMHSMEDAYRSICVAASLAPSHNDIAFAKAQFTYETWRPAKHLFEELLSNTRYNYDIVKSAALTFVAEGSPDHAIQLLSDHLLEKPDWVNGHELLATINSTTDRQAIDDSFQIACKNLPANDQLRMAWFYLHSKARNWDTAKEILESFTSKFKETTDYKISEIFLRSESGENVKNEEFDKIDSPYRHPEFDLCRVRFYLRNGDPTRAEKIAQFYIDKSAAKSFWPYLSICWRLKDNCQFEWLERGGDLASVSDLSMNEDELKALGATLRKLHKLNRPYIEQSIRGGTQTDRHLFFNPNANIQNLKQRVHKSITRYIASLPSLDQRHPFLNRKPRNVRYSGAWSVALSGQGYHRSHTHVLGWLSSAMYISVPADSELGPTPSGYLSFGSPPAELGLQLNPYKQIKPQVGNLVLFPSYTWHKTEPFHTGERLTVAFDAVPSLG